MKILIIGCGKTGAEIARSLVSIPEVEKIYLLSKIYDESRALEKELNNHKALAISSMDNLENISSIDYTIIALANIPKEEREKSFHLYKTSHDMRQHELRFNFYGIKHIANSLKPHSPKIKFVIVTNPSEEITNYLRHTLNNKNVFGFGTHLDAKRYSKVIGKEVLCLGPHGRAFPLINAKSHDKYDSLLKQVDSELIEHLKKKGIPNEQVGLEFREFFEKLNGKKESILHICSYLHKPFLGVKDISISLPFKVKNGKVLGPAKIKANKIEKEKFIKLASDLKISVDKLISHGVC
jgi:malate/lactate dehydrogenase